MLLQCIVCCRSRAIMQVSPCGHQCLCRLCFVQNIKEAVASRNLPLRCLICNAKIARVKNNRSGGGTTGNGTDHPVHVRGLTTNILRPTPAQSGMRKMPTSVSGYSLCATSATSGGESVNYEDEQTAMFHNNNNHLTSNSGGGQAVRGLPPSASSYSMSSGG